MASPLTRLRLPLDRHRSDLMVVGDRFDEGGRYVQFEVRRVESAGWGLLDWEASWEELESAWRGRFEVATASARQEG